MADTIGGELRLWRKKVGLTQEEVAARLGVSRERYANWERGSVGPPLEFRLKLAELGVAAIPGMATVREERAPYGDSVSPSILRILIETIYDCARDPDLRAESRRELYRVLHIPDGG